MLCVPCGLLEFAVTGAWCPLLWPLLCSGALDILRQKPPIPWASGQRGRKELLEGSLWTSGSPANREQRHSLSDLLLGKGPLWLGFQSHAFVPTLPQRGDKESSQWRAVETLRTSTRMPSLDVAISLDGMGFHTCDADNGDCSDSAETLVHRGQRMASAQHRNVGEIPHKTHEGPPDCGR